MTVSFDKDRCCTDCHHSVQVLGKKGFVCMAFLEIRQTCLGPTCVEFEARRKVLSTLASDEASGGVMSGMVAAA